MRLLTRNSYNHIILTEDLKGHDTPPYAILSHTWGADNDEVNFADMQHGGAMDKIGYKKIEFCDKQAQKDQIKHFWVDTCCINKSDSSELSEAINSMYRWYRDAKKCYVYLSDVQALQSGDDVNNPPTQQLSLRNSRWFTRGWTLQELIAPKVVEFFTRDGTLLGTKKSLAQLICEITTLPLAALYGTSPTQFPIAERWRWAQGRQTSRSEDGAYCLFGIFEVFLPPIYGEGEYAFLRLENEINARSTVSIRAPSSHGHVDKLPKSRPSPASTQHASIDDWHSENTPKRRKICQAEADDVQNRSQAIEKVQSSKGDKSDTLLKSLLFDRLDFRVNNVRKALLSTCEWLLRHPGFLAWYRNSTSAQHDGFFWTKGKPGCGKSTLMKAALEWARKKNAQDSVGLIIVPYFFNA